MVSSIVSTRLGDVVWIGIHSDELYLGGDADTRVNPFREETDEVVVYGSRNVHCDGVVVEPALGLPADAPGLEVGDRCP